MLRCISCCAAFLAVTGGLHASAAALQSGVDMQYVDRSVRPQDDLYRYLNGKWLDRFQLPPDKGSYGSFTYAYDATQEQLHAIVDSLGTSGANGAAERKLADLYASFMDEDRIETLGLQPLRTEFAAIDAISDKNEIPALIAHLNRIGAGAPYDIVINQDARNSSQYAVIVHQSGLGMPDRDYYLKDDAKLKDARAKYLTHIGKMLGMSGDAEAEEHAAAILELETSMAQAQWSRVESRDPVKTYNKTAIADLATLMPVYDWQRYLRGSDIAGKADSVIVNQPSYFNNLDKLMSATPLPVWQAYFRWHVLSAAAPYLAKAFVEERFAFAGTLLSGIPENRARWKRGMTLLDGAGISAHWTG
jgi:putative endopeptidase